MLARLRERRAAARGVEFCDSCGQVCTSQCRAQARIDRTRVEVLLLAAPLR